MLYYPHYQEMTGSEFISFGFDKVLASPELKGLTPSGFNKSRKPLADFDKLKLVIAYDALAEALHDATNGRKEVYLGEIYWLINEYIQLFTEHQAPKVDEGYIILAMHKLNYKMHRDVNHRIFYRITSARVQYIENFIRSHQTGPSAIKITALNTKLKGRFN